MRILVLMMAMLLPTHALGQPAPSARLPDNAPPATTRPADFAAQPTTGPLACEYACDPLTAPGTDSVQVSIPGKGRTATCYVHRPADYAPGQRPPLIVCLHGTDDTAEQMIEFWRSRRLRIPAVIAAPQGAGRGWSSEDVPTIRATFDYLSHCVWHDPHRVLLVGFSAGGVMAFQVLYHEQLPMTAAAALANYVPPRLTADQVRERRHVPVFYAVGMTDINHELMRSGLEFLRSAGANVELYHPPIGHTLDPGVAQAALDWFFNICDKQTDRAIAQAIESAKAGTQPGVSAQRLEQIVAQPLWYGPKQVRRATEALEQLEQPGRAKMQSAQALVAESLPGEALELYDEVARTYGLARLGVEARTRRSEIEADPRLGQLARQYFAARRSEQAMSEYASAQKLVARGRLAEAAGVCRRVLEVYADTPAAARADRLLKLIDGRSNP